MNPRPSSLHALRRVFRHSFSAYDITELLISCERDADASDARRFMQSRGLEVAGVVYQGEVIGFIERKDLGEGTCAGVMQTFGEDQVVPDSTPLADLVLLLDRYSRVFVSVFGGIGGIITRTDLQKPPVRMWLFGMITLIEMKMAERIEHRLTEQQVRQSLSEGRLRKAEELLARRAERQHPARLIECLQFSDKFQIIARSRTLRAATGFPSKKQFEKTLRLLEGLRDNLAHSQDYVSSDWEALVALAHYVDDLIDDVAQPGPL